MKNFGIGSLSCYDNLDQIGEGTYGYVFKARDKRDDSVVALKRLIFHRESAGFPLNAVREVKFLKSLSHKNIVLLKDVITSKGCEHIEVLAKPLDESKVDKKNDNNINDNKKRHAVDSDETMKICGNLYLVFEYIEHDLGGLIDSKYKFSTKAIKSIMKQLLEVLEYLSEKKILHRDIKSSNILLTNRNQVKLADFGLARSTQSWDGREFRIDMTNNVITMWYKPPELLLGAVRYSYSTDIWSAGCVLAELELGRPLFPGKTEIEQLELICKVLGTPTEDFWPGLSKMSNFDSLLKPMPRYNTSLKTSYQTKLSDPAIAFLERILVTDPDKRSSAKIALTHKYFTSAPSAPLDPMELEPLHHTLGGLSCHEYKTKLLRKQKEENEANPTEVNNNNPFIANLEVDNNSNKNINNNNNNEATYHSFVPRPPPPPPLPLHFPPAVPPPPGSVVYNPNPYNKPVPLVSGPSGYSQLPVDSSKNSYPSHSASMSYYGAPVTDYFDNALVSIL